ncbi:MAG: rod shape-determining protein MreD, partial [Chloroflexi bacterium]|nr:rod shape-determining protein MreD [Chloroflexota bacterium]
MAIGLYIAIPLVALTAVVQSTLGPRLRVFGVSPDLVLLFLIAWVLLHGLRGSLSVSLVGGLMLDALSGAPF